MHDAGDNLMAEGDLIFLLKSRNFRSSLDFLFIPWGIFPKNDPYALMFPGLLVKCSTSANYESENVMIKRFIYLLESSITKI